MIIAQNQGRKNAQKGTKMNGNHEVEPWPAMHVDSDWSLDVCRLIGQKLS